MEWFGPVDWYGMFAADTPLIEIFIRGSVIYLVLFCLLRFVLKRQVGSLGMSDILLISLLADAAQNGMADDYSSLPDGIALVATLIFWNYVLEWLGYRFPAVGRVLHAPPLPLIKNGRMIRKHMAMEFITEQELMSKLRQQGVEKISEVKKACLEGDGKISVVTKE